MLFTDNVIERIARHTDLYSAQELGDPIKTSPREILDFLAVPLLMGVLNSPATQDCWHHDSRVHRHRLTEPHRRSYPDVRQSPEEGRMWCIWSQVCWRGGRSEMLRQQMRQPSEQRIWDHASFKCPTVEQRGPPVSVTHFCLQEWGGLICLTCWYTCTRPQPSQGTGTFHCLDTFMLLQQYTHESKWKCWEYSVCSVPVLCDVYLWCLFLSKVCILLDSFYFFWYLCAFQYIDHEVTSYLFG